jgi:hypothetical protein
MKIQHMKKKQDRIWTTQDLVLLGLWLLKQGEYGHGLLCIHGACTGIKVGTLLKLRWKDFINPVSDECHFDLFFKEGKIKNVQLSHFIQRNTQFVFASTNDGKQVTYKTPVYTNAKTGQVLTTSSLNRELQRFYEQFKNETFEKTGIELNFAELKTNAFEIAWGRDMVNHYNRTKKVFIAVSKYMGHRTVNDTIRLLQIEPNDEITLRFDLYNPDVKTEMQLDETLEDDKKLKEYFLKQEKATIEFLS